MSGFWISLLVLAIGALGACYGATVDYDSRAIIIDGQRRLLVSGAIHYPRSTTEMWPDLIQKAKDGGLDAIESYIFWNAHEPHRRQYNFAGNLDFVQFFKKVQAAGLYGILRIGPYACAEWNYGGFPVWLHNFPGIELRTDNALYKNEMQTFVTKIVNMVKEAKLFASQGGPIILGQIENEYGNIMGPYGDAGKAYVQWCAKTAVAQNIGVPWIMCQQADAPSPVISTCNGFYCDEFYPNNPNYPKMWTENWTGWFKKCGDGDPHRAAEDVAFAVARFFQKGGVLQNYYMYHGGTNFGRSAGGPFIMTSYDYDAPLDEYGNLNQPKWGHLKNLHAAIKVGEKVLTAPNNTITTQKTGWVELTTFTDNANGNRFCFLSNTNTVNATIDLKQDGKYFLPPWSVSILQDCNKEIHNTAKVNVQTSIMIKKSEGTDKVQKLSWMWAPELIRDTPRGKGKFRANQLIEQKATTSDASDYLWYMTIVHNNATTWKNVTLRANYSGQVLHAYVNSKLLDTQFGYTFQFEPPVRLKPGTNTITLLSATVALQNYGSFFDKGPEGIAGGPVQLMDGNTTIDLSKNQWSYKIGLNGEARQLSHPSSPMTKWNSGKVPVGRPMTWYKTIFRAPSGTDPVVVDLLGMGKGHAWVNGNSLGRFWPSQIASNTGCTNTCDYLGKYDPSKCNTNCGNSSQISYHVPRSFLKPGLNTMILLEEFGGNPSNVSFQIVTPQTICGHAYEGNTLEMSCGRGHVISGIQFASFGNPHGSCGSFQKGSYDAPTSITTLQKACVGKQTCSINVSKATFGVDKLASDQNRLAVRGVCQ